MSPTSLTRRSLLGAAGAATVGVGLAACTPDQGPGSPDPGGPGAGGSGGGVQLPVTTPYEGVEADLPALPNGTVPYFSQVPIDPPKFLDEKPGNGEEITAHVQMTSPVVPLGNNPRWQSLNDMLGIKLNLIGPPSGYADKFATLVVNDDLPDIVTVLPTLTNQVSSLMGAKFTDLTEYLSGDAINEYPALANMPQYNWSGGSVYDHKIFLVPKPNAALFRSYVVRADIADERGLNPQPTNGDELLELMAGLTDPKENRYAVGTWDGILDMVHEMVGSPNEWRVTDGRFTKSWETEEYLEGLSIVAQMWDKQYIHPDGFSASIKSQTTGLFIAGHTPMFPVPAQWAGRALQAQKENPDARTQAIMLPAWDGSADHVDRWLGAGTPYRIGIPKTDPDRVRLLLRVINALSAPFGTQEYVEITYGVEGTDYNREADGRIVPTEIGTTNNLSPVMYAGDAVPVHYSEDPELGKAEYESEKTDMDHVAAQPQVDLESPTHQKQGAMLQAELIDVVQGVIQGRNTIDEFNRAVDDWRKNGGDTIRAEFEAAYEAANS